MYIVYKSFKNRLIHGTEREVTRLIPKLDKTKEWHMGVDGSSTAYGLCIYTKDYSDINMFMFIRDGLETIDGFRETMYNWLQFYLIGIPIEVATYERTPEGYKPPSSHAEKVMRETEEAIRNFLNSPHYIMIKSKDFVFDIFPNSWKSFVIPKSASNKGKIDKEQNAVAVLEHCGLDVDYWLGDINQVPVEHSFDCYEALGIGTYASHFIIKPDGTIRVYRQFTKIGSYLVVAKEVYRDSYFQQELEFIGSFGGGKRPRMAALNETHSLPENLIGLADAEYNNILLIPAEHELSIYIRAMFGFSKVNRDFLILATRASTSEEGKAICERYGYSSVYM